MIDRNNDKDSLGSNGLLPQLESLAGEFVYLIRHELRQIKGEVQLADGQIFLLMILSRLPFCKASDIACHIGITSGAVTGMTDKLVNMGLITRERSEEDRRVVLFSITDKGRETVHKIVEIRGAWLRNFLCQLSIEEMEKAVEVFAKLKALIELRRSGNDPAEPSP
ncbi:MarR family winged helix-turn-helix transcriptional regulator [Paenibacillus sp. J2TS4]|uniref:MarR family winged helix-turn-helix transcriptional regulator n=1 Tax=Paenibacillus sp. J2TS4 TaxID=2807194 RepID=UPI001B213185|nr:MarR family transcriptional regulator [Paenibacillus sp. J2TS4]GIP33798.1 MarR family transcriptional regulator [Paenibacillus sp. J2TS4]